MAKILLNPDTGAPINDVVYNGTAYFSGRESFRIGTLFKFEDDKTADFFMKTFEFLQELSTDDAKKFMSFTKLKCSTCGFETRIKSELEQHAKEHAKDKELDELGIPVVKKQESERARFEESINTDIQKSIDSDAIQDGLTEGEGLLSDKPQKTVIMS